MGPGRGGGDGARRPLHVACGDYLVAAARALTRPAPKKLLLPTPPEQTCTGASKNSTPGSSSPGQGIAVAVRRRSAATAPPGIPGWAARISAATPAACGAA